ncbi:hypothetical protein NPX79_03590 [Spiroplasma endosymbiont of Anurida maritima]|uniref:hypothetical protein n=1 Tax=Spiroplasma endosymbiont of Anurida maritima TaxID=2967972 RepID=UPI0036D27BD1
MKKILILLSLISTIGVSVSSIISCGNYQKNPEANNKETKEVVQEEKEVVQEEKEVVQEEKEVVQEEKEVVQEEKEVVQEEKEVVQEEKEVVQEEKEVVQEEKEVVQEEKEVVQEEKEVVQEEKEVVQEEKEVVQEEKEVVQEEKEVVQEEKEVVQEEKEVVQEEKEVVQEEKEVVQEEKEVVQEEKEVVQEEKEVRKNSKSLKIEKINIENLNLEEEVKNIKIENIKLARKYNFNIEEVLKPIILNKIYETLNKKNIKYDKDSILIKNIFKNNLALNSKKILIQADFNPWWKSVDLSLTLEVSVKDKIFNTIKPFIVELSENKDEYFKNYFKNQAFKEVYFSINSNVEDLKHKILQNIYKDLEAPIREEKLKKSDILINEIYFKDHNLNIKISNDSLKNKRPKTIYLELQYKDSYLIKNNNEINIIYEMYR